MTKIQTERLLARAGLVLIALVGADAARASEDRKWYATGTAGFVTQSDQQLDYTRPGVAGVTSRTLPLDNGILTGAAIGRYVGDAWRVEAEFMYQSVDHPNFTLVTGTAGDGNYASTTVAVNALRDFDLFGSPSAKTYAGLGAVYATEVDVDFETGGVEKSFSGSGAGVQALIGARYSFGERAFVDAGVRYLLVSGVELDAEEGGAVGRIEADYEPLAVTVSFGWRF
jgi:outer membrane protein W